MTVNFHDHKKVLELTFAGLLVDVDYIIQGYYTSIDTEKIFYEFW